MRKLAALVLVASLMPGCCLVGTTIGGSRASAHNDEVARKLSRGEALDPDDQPESVTKARLAGFAIGAAIDIALSVAVVSSRYSNVNSKTLDPFFGGE